MAVCNPLFLFNRFLNKAVLLILKRDMVMLKTLFFFHNYPVGEAGSTDILLDINDRLLLLQ